MRSNQIFNLEDIEKKTLLILRILQESSVSVGARIISRKLREHDVDLSERAVRYHLKMMDNRGMTRLVGRHDGRVITEQGVEELDNARVRDKIGFVISNIEFSAFKTTLNPDKRRGLLPVNISFFPKKSFKQALEMMKPAFEAGLHVSELVACAYEGSQLGEVAVPKGYVGFATVSSVVVNGLFLKNGIPMDSQFGGILQIRNNRPLRFVELIRYSGSSLDPSEVFIQGKMTSVHRAAEAGEGKILANFREIPVPARKLAEVLVTSLRNAGIGGILTIGEIGKPVCQIPVETNRIGMILFSGLNPVACAHERGIARDNRAINTIVDYQELLNFWELCKK